MTTTENLALAGLQGGEMVQTTDAAMVGAAAREYSHIQASLMVADARPRDERRAYGALMKAVTRPGMAEGACYSFPRGGKPVTGPSVYLAREAARLWGNMSFSLRIVSMDDEEVHIEGVAWDLQTNHKVSMEDRFRPLIQRRRDGKAQWVKADERDLRELINRRGAICVRNAILQILPTDVVDEALQVARKTVEDIATGKLNQDPERAVRATIASFSQLGVTVPMLEAFLDHPVEHLTGEEVATLRAVYTGIRDGAASVADHFDIGAGRPKREPDAKIKMENLKPKQEAKPPSAGFDDLNNSIASAVTLADVKDFAAAVEKAYGEGAIDIEQLDFLQKAVKERKAALKKNK